jgi:1,4-dihydroxy-2-naphthoate octaprenyltransferase
MNYDKLSLKNIVQLAAPHTWAASIMPVLLGTELSIAFGGGFRPVLFVLMLVASVLMQSSVNTLNDYRDFVKGTDRPENSDDPNDAVLVYNNIKPSHARILGFAFMLAAVACGIYPVLCGGITTFVIGFIGCAVIVLYTVGKKTLSDLPVGEAVSGITMGGFITCGVYSVYIPWAPIMELLKILLLSLPLIISIALIMMTNNICDIERDEETGRKTIPTILGRKKAKFAYRTISVFWLVSIVSLMSVYFVWGLIVSLAALAISIGVIVRLLTIPLTPEQRGPCMGAIIKANYFLGVSYLVGIGGHVVISRLIIYSNMLMEKY